MKKKIFLAVIAIFVICLTCGMLFVACNDKEDDNGGKNPGDITDETTKQEDVFKDVVYALQDVRDDTTGNKEFNFALDIVDLNTDASVFTLATETIGGEDFFYGAIGSEMRKIKGFDLGGIIEEVLGWIGDRISVSIVTIDFDADGFLSGMIGGIVPSLLGDVAVSDNGEAYYLNLNILAVVEAIAGVGVNFDTLIPAEYSWIIPTVVDVLGIDIPTEGDKDPGLMDVLNFIANNYAINFYFGFGANADVDKEDTEDNKPFDNFEISDKVAAARKDLAAAGLISFQSELEFEALDVTEDGSTAAETVAHKYVLDIDIDLDPFVLVREYGEYEFGILSMLKTSGTVADGNFKIGFNDEKFSMDTIMDMVADAGYLHISLDDVAIEASEGVAVGDVVKNLFTLHFNSEEGKAIVSAAIVEEVLGKNYAVGGVYDLNALATIINSLIPAGPAAEECQHVDADKNCICDNCGAVTDPMGLVSYLLGNIGNFIKVEKSGETVTGATVMFQEIADFLINNVVKHAITEEQLAVVEAQLPTLMKSVIGGNALRVNLTGISFKYGLAIDPDKYVKESELVFNLREDESLTGTNDDMYMETVTGVTAKEGTDIAPGSRVTVTGTAFDGKTTITTSGIIMAVDGDTYYVGILTDFYANYAGAEAIVNGFIGEAGTHVDLDTLIKPNWPFYGVLAYTVPAQA